MGKKYVKKHAFLEEESLPGHINKKGLTNGIFIPDHTLECLLLFLHYLLHFSSSKKISSQR